jgi:hypothetical protein
MGVVRAAAKSISASGLIAVVATCGLLVSACGSSSSSSKTEVTPTPTPTPKSQLIEKVDACTVVTAADASSATGTAMTNLGGAGAAQVAGACIYASSDGSTTVVVIAQAYANASSADAVDPKQLAAALNGAYAIADAKSVSGIGDKAVEYTVSGSGTSGTVIFVFKSNVVIMIAITPTTAATGSAEVEDLARTAVGHL